VPVEFIHDLYGHDDTVDVLLPGGVTSIETAHHHCAILKIEFPQYLHHEAQPVFMADLFSGNYFIVYHNPYLPAVQHTIGQRGPPSFNV
jgi:hypothetical protein